MRTGLDSLLGEQERHASFHDASLLDLHIDYAESSLVATFSLFIGDPHARDRDVHELRRSGRLRLSGLLHWSIEPSTEGTPLTQTPWLTDDGVLDQAPTENGRKLAASLPPDCVAWYLFFSDLNTFAYCAAEHAEFEWF